MGYVTFMTFVKYILICLNADTSRGDTAYNLQERFVVKFRDTQQPSQYNTNSEPRCEFFKLYMYF